MAYNGIKQIVIDTASDKVKRWGFCDMENDGQFDANTETMVESDFLFEPSINDKIWTWNGSTFLQGDDVVISEKSALIQQIDINAQSKMETYRTLGRVIILGADVTGSIKTIEGIMYKDDQVTSYDARIIDRGNNSTVIAEVTGQTNIEDAIIDFGALSNLPSSKTRLDIQLRRNGGSSNHYVYLNSILIRYY